MAPTSPMTSRYLDGYLAALWAEIDGLPDTAKAWQEFDDDEKYDFVLEWWNLLGMFRALVEAAAADKLDPEQVRLYERLVHRYEEVLPLIKQLDLSTIPVPKLSTQHR